jgi:hypothetical protein
LLLNTSTESEARTLTIVGAAMVLATVLVLAILIVAHPFRSRPTDRITVAIDAPFVGQGVAKGTALIMHGVKVGEITAITSSPRGGVRVDADLQAGPTEGLTDAMDIDFRSINYFGVTGINLTAGSGGQALRDGMRINKVPTGNFTLQALLSRLGSISSAALTPQLIGVIDRATRYTDALDPLVETVVIAANAVTKVQTVSTAQLLTNTTGLSVALPSFLDAAIDAADRLDHSKLDTMTEDFYRNRALISSDLGTKALFDRFGQLEGKRMTELLPFIELAQSLTDIVPGLIRPESIEHEIMEVRTRFEKLYAGTPEQRALQVRIVLDSLPGVATPLAAMGGPQ